MKKKILSLVLGLMLAVSAGIPALADGEWKVALGGDLSASQREEVFSMLGLTEEETQVFTVSIGDEKELLEGLVPSDKIGSRSLSCVSVRPLAEGDGIRVSTENITWVSEGMYASALATAGIADAEVQVVCPVKVSGTAALAGIFKAYEATSGELSETAKDVAAEELVTTGELGDIIGQEKAAEFIALLKQKALELGYNDPATVRQLVVQIAGELNITLTEEQITTITNLIVTIVNMDIDPEKLSQQVDKINESLQSLAQNSQQALNFVASIRDFFNNLVDWFSSLFQ